MTAHKPINIIFNNKDNKDNDFLQCIFDLTIKLKNVNQDINFKELLFSKYCNIISHSNKIKFNMIESYTLNITSKSHYNREVYSITNNFILSDDIHIYKNDDIYIEFTQNNEGYINCCTYLKVLDDNRVFITPPNYF